MISSVRSVFALGLQERTESNIKLQYGKQPPSRKAKLQRPHSKILVNPWELSGNLKIWVNIWELLVNLCIWFFTVSGGRSQPWNVVVPARPLIPARGSGCVVSSIICVFLHYCNCPTPCWPFGALHQVSDVHPVSEHWTDPTPVNSSQLQT